MLSTAATSGFAGSQREQRLREVDEPRRRAGFRPLGYRRAQGLDGFALDKSARLDHVSQDQPDGDRERGRQKEEDHHAQADPAKLGDSSRRGEAADDGAEDQGNDDHLDEQPGRVFRGRASQLATIVAVSGIDPGDGGAQHDSGADAENHADQHLQPQAAAHQRTDAFTDRNERVGMPSPARMRSGISHGRRLVRRGGLPYQHHQASPLVDRSPVPAGGRQIR